MSKKNTPMVITNNYYKIKVITDKISMNLKNDESKDSKNDDSAIYSQNINKQDQNLNDGDSFINDSNLKISFHQESDHQNFDSNQKYPNINENDNQDSNYQESNNAEINDQNSDKELDEKCSENNKTKRKRKRKKRTNTKKEPIKEELKSEDEPNHQANQNLTKRRKKKMRKKIKKVKEDNEDNEINEIENCTLNEFRTSTLKSYFTSHYEQSKISDFISDLVLDKCELIIYAIYCYKMNEYEKEFDCIESEKLYGFITSKENLEYFITMNSELNVEEIDKNEEKFKRNIDLVFKLIIFSFAIFAFALFTKIEKHINLTNFNFNQKDIQTQSKFKEYLKQEIEINEDAFGEVF